MKPVGIIIAVILGIVFLTLIVAKELEFDLFRNEPEYSINTLEELCLVEDEIFGRSDLAQQYRNAKFQYSNRDPSDYSILESATIDGNYGRQFAEEFDINPILISYVYHRVQAGEIRECKS